MEKEALSILASFSWISTTETMQDRIVGCLIFAPDKRCFRSNFRRIRRLIMQFRDFTPDCLDFLAASGHAHAARGSLGGEQTRSTHLDSDRSS